ncbi:MAG: nucleotidyl transferase AbiEii/AbiGii toxin family protein [bacterium]
MFEQVLIKDTKEHLALLSRSVILKDAYLAGGTACALQLGHRLSIDFDFFTIKDFEPKIVAAELANLAAFEVEEIIEGTVLGKFLGTKFSLFKYQYPLIYPPLQYQSISIAEIRDIAAMKLDAIASRGTKRDFIDLYFICHSNYKLSELMAVYDRKYKMLASNLMHIKKSLIFFDDAEADAMPVMLKDIKWQDVKKYFENEVRHIVVQ